MIEALSIQPRRPSALQQIIPIAVLFLFVLAAVLLLVMGKALDHDEHQFVASGALLARRSLLPYRDYPYFHTPILVLVYGGLFRLSDHLLLTARLFCGACAVGMAAVLFIFTYCRFRSLSFWPRFAAGAGAVLLLLANPLFSQTSGRAWNHDPAILLASLAFLAACAEHKRARASGSSIACGLLIGLAIGTRLTFAPTVAVLAVMMLAAPVGEDSLRPANWPRRVSRLLLFTLGLITGLLPVFVLAWTSPRGFVFGNFRYPMLNTAFRIATSSKYETSLIGRLIWIGRSVMLQPGTLLLLVLLVLVVMDARRRAAPKSLARSFLPVMILFLLPGALAPTPAFAQYFYVLVPFTILWIVEALSSGVRNDVNSPRTLRIPAVIVAIGVLIGCAGYVPARRQIAASRWPPLEVHEIGQTIHRLAGEGKILTLNPIYALEGGNDIYETYATGPFAARVAPMMTPEDRDAVKLWDARRLDEELNRTPPAAVLGGIEGDTDAPLLAYAHATHQPPIVMIGNPDPRKPSLKLWIIPNGH